MVEMRDFLETGYLFPVRDAPAVLANLERFFNLAAAAVATTWKFKLTFTCWKYIWNLGLDLDEMALFGENMCPGRFWICISVA